MIKDYVEQILILTYRSAAGEVEQVLSLPRAEATVGDTVYAIIRYIENNIFRYRRHPCHRFFPWVQLFLHLTCSRNVPA